MGMAIDWLYNKFFSSKQPEQKIDSIHVRDCIHSKKLYLGDFGYVISLDAKCWDGKKQVHFPYEKLYVSRKPLAPGTVITPEHETNLKALSPFIEGRLGKGYADTLGKEMAKKARAEYEKKNMCWKPSK